MAAGHDEPPESGSKAAEKTPPAAEAPGAPRPSSWRWSAAFRAVAGFAPNTIVAGRFRIVRFIGSGGMGEVYEAEDQELNERVALKTVRPEIADEERVMERFRREIQLARRVTHPSVCRSFDVFRHRIAAPPGWEGPTPEVAFLSMELLEGETLAERIRTKGPLATEEALPIVRQVAAALAAAHEARVVHRDFKSSNVVLVPPKKAEQSVRAVVTDFGLARGGTTGDSRDESASVSAGLAGTPAYMAPEQVEGGAVTPATDVYALGVVMYEMVTGQWPFAGDTPLAMAVKRLNEKAPSPRGLAPKLDRSWEAAILRCLERDPADRFASPLDVPKALAGEDVPPGPGRTRRRRQRIAVAAAVGLSLLFGAGLWWLRPPPQRGEPGPPPPAAGVSSRRAIAVLGFKNLSGREDAAWLTRALAEMLTMELAAGGETLRIIPGESVARMKVDLSLPETDSLAPDTLGRIRKNLGTDLVVLGSYFAAGKDSGGRLRLDLRVQDTASGETTAILSDNGTEAEVLALVSRVGQQLRQKLGAGKPAAAESEGSRASLPSTPEAARFYSEGLAKLRFFDALAARDLLEKAAAADPKYPLTHSALAEAWSALGYDARAKAEARKAFDLSGSLSREERLLVEGRYHEAAREWDKAIETYRTLWGFFPDNLEYGLLLATAQTSSGKGKDALTGVEALRKLPKPTSDDARIDLAEAEAAGSLGEHNRARVAAARAAEKGAAQGSRLLVAGARLQDGITLRYLGDRDKGVAACEEARQIYAAAGDRSGVARALIEIANGLMYQGDLAGAKARAEEALAIARETGDKSGMARSLHRVGSVLKEQGRIEDALEMYQESRTIAREIGERYREATAANNIADILRNQGELAAARRLLEESGAVFREIGDRRGVTFSTMNLGFVLLDQGDLPGARKAFQESLTLGLDRDKGLEASAILGLGRVIEAEGDLVLARRTYEESLKIRTLTGEKTLAAEVRLSLAAVALEDGRPADAGSLATEALEELHREGAGPREALAQAVLADALLAQRKFAEGRGALDRAKALSEKSTYRSLRLRVALTAARERVGFSRPAEAVQILNAAVGEAKKYGLLSLHLEARLALGEIELRFGDQQTGRRSLAILEADARASGFGLIARKARQLLS